MLKGEHSAEHSAILLTFIKLPFVIKIIVLSIFEWPFYTGFTVTAVVELFSSTVQKKMTFKFWSYILRCWHFEFFDSKLISCSCGLSMKNVL